MTTDLWNLMGTVSSLGVIAIFAAAIYKMGYAQGMWQGKIQAEHEADNAKANLRLLHKACERWLEGDSDESSLEFISKLRNYAHKWSE